jgi:sigma-B regulation protein RsbU (phosphoserine phosphatase)
MSSGQPVDVILLDLTLPDSSGLATLHGIKNINDRIPVIILTGMSSEEIAYQAVSKALRIFW